MSRTVESDQHVSAAVLAAYSYCETVTGQQARNFAYGIGLLPTAKRRAMSAVYAFSRRVDDIGDGALPPDVKADRLDETRALLARVRDGDVAEDDTDPVGVALAHAAHQFPIPLGGLDELIDGVLMDLRGETYETWDDLKVYCRCVAGAIGRVSLGIFGTEPGARGAERASEYADTLGLALQLTNILRDVREDAADGRTYLPADDLAKFGCSAGFDAPTPPAGSDFAGLVHFEVRRARALFAEGTGSFRCSTGAVAPASPPWRASTGAFSTASSASPRPSCAAVSRSPGARRRTSPCAACPVSTLAASPGSTSGGVPDERLRQSGPHRRETAGNPPRRRGVHDFSGLPCVFQPSRAH